MMIYNLINRFRSSSLPKASEVLNAYLKQENYPHWTAFFIKYKDVVNDQFSQTCFLNKTENNSTYLILRTGCFPFIKYHCSKLDNNAIDYKIIKFQNNFFNLIKIINLGMQSEIFTSISSYNFLIFQGIPTFGYGLAGLLLAKHQEIVCTQNGNVKIYFWYKENKESPY